jgi:hypothetical protein
MWRATRRRAVVGGREQWKSDTRDSKRYAKGRLIADVEGLEGAGGLEG